MSVAAVVPLVHKFLKDFSLCRRAGIAVKNRISRFEASYYQGPKYPVFFIPGIETVHLLPAGVGLRPPDGYEDMRLKEPCLAVMNRIVVLRASGACFSQCNSHDGIYRSYRHAWGKTGAEDGPFQAQKALFELNRNELSEHPNADRYRFRKAEVRQFRPA